jgi:hypothetical protein
VPGKTGDREGGRPGENDGISDVEEQFVSEGSVEEDEIRVSGESVLTIRDEASGATVHDDPPTDDD